MNCVYLKQLSDQIKITSDYLNSLISQLNDGLQAGSHPAAASCPVLNNGTRTSAFAPHDSVRVYHPAPIVPVCSRDEFQYVRVPGVDSKCTRHHAPEPQSTFVPGVEHKYNGQYVPEVKSEYVSNPTNDVTSPGVEYGTEQSFRNYQIDTLSKSVNPPTHNPNLIYARKNSERNRRRMKLLHDHINRNKNKKYKNGLKNKLMKATLNTESVSLPSVESLLANVSSEESPLVAQVPKTTSSFFSDQDNLMNRRIVEYNKREERLADMGECN